MGFSTKNSTGLGLSFVKNVVQNHEGNMELYSTKNQGTKLIITLPEAEYNEQQHKDTSH